MNPANSAEALTAVQQAQSQAQDPNAYLSQQRQQLGVNDAQNTVTGLRGAINNTTKLLQQVAPSIMGRTASSLVNAGQAQRQIANEQAPISATLTDQGGQYNEANQSLSRLQDQASQAAAGQYQGQQDKLSYLQNVYNNLYQREQDATTQAEQKRQFDIQAAQAAKGSGGYDLSSLLGGGSDQYATSTDQNGGTQFTLQGKPITAAQYFSGKGGGIQDVANFLKQDKNSQQAYNDLISGKFTPAQLQDKYSYIFGGV
jgi:predicted transcriptional regulator